MADVLSPPMPSQLFAGAFQGKTVFVTGHTGFKGAWLTLWLQRLGARVVGYALNPPTTPSLFEEARLNESIVHCVGDIRDRERLFAAVKEHRPDVVLHLAAQPLVRLSYEEPAETYDVNVMGTVNVLDAVRAARSVKACVIVTSDKCYENREWVYAYRENDPMGGYDPYSSSKGCAELVTSAYRNSFFHPERMTEHGVCVATVRAGNVIGGGDWALDRIVPDCVRAIEAGDTITVRNPHAIRPWQHVLEPLSGYLWLTARMLAEPEAHADGWNFGPSSAGNVTVREIVELLTQMWGEGRWAVPQGVSAEAQPHEARFLKLDITKSTNLLRWEPVYDVQQTLHEVVEWYAGRHRTPKFDARAMTLHQIETYERQAFAKGVAWATTTVR